jgi:hypothetical protein
LVPLIVSDSLAGGRAPAADTSLSTPHTHTTQMSSNGVRVDIRARPQTRNSDSLSVCMYVCMYVFMYLYMYVCM